MGSAAKRAERFLLQFGVTLRKFFPRWSEWLERIPDPRQEAKCSYHLSALLWVSLLMMLSGQESRNQYNENLFNEETQAILEKLLGVTLPAMPHGDTLAHLWKQLEPDLLEKLKITMVRVLLRSRCLEKFRYQGYYLLAVDGTELYRWSEPHCNQCLHAASGPNHELQYYHRVLEVKLVSSSGLSLSILSEFIENGGADAKQDCELKAFYRVSAKLKKRFPQLKILLLADGIYPKGPVFALCEDAGWKYLIVLKDEVLTTVWQDFQGLMDIPPNALGVRDKAPVKIIGDKLYRWQNDLSYQGEQFEGLINLLEVQSLNRQTGEYTRCRAFVTNLRLSQPSVERLEGIGQQRWKIENQGFDIQKHHGYALEHLWCRHPNALKVVYHLIQIAHLFNQLFILADLRDQKLQQMSFKAFFKLFGQALTQTWSASLAQQWEDLKTCQFQVRWQI